MHVVVDEVGRADAVLARSGPLSRTRCQALIRAGAVELNGATLVDPAHRVAPGDQLVLTEPPAIAATPQAQSIALDVCHEDAFLLVLNKPAGLVVHPGAGHADGTLVNALLAHCGDSLSGIGGVMRPGIVHRLDKDTSGLMVVAKTDAAHQGLAAQFADHGRSGPLKRLYEALVWGTPHPFSGTIDKPLGRHPADRLRFAVRPGGKMAVTHYETRARLGLITRIAARLETGRTHQIRVHMAAIGTPLVADPLYAAGFATKASRLAPDAKAALVALGRHALHAGELGFAHPITGETLLFRAPPPDDFAALTATLDETDPLLG